ncbi:unnamed protein product, partial [Mesorhabditis belari]|uniref:Uncharacterized protein n=1 Tax=Mesorhabditis belari TaxID=2138241 RepID=A0AAF3EDS7_9BILA
MFVERLEIELEAKQALQADYDRVKADQEQFLLEFEELVDPLSKSWSSGALDQAFRSDFDSLEEAIARTKRFRPKDRQCSEEARARGNGAMSGAIGSRIEVGPCCCEESMQLRHRNNSLQEQLQYLTDVVGKDETEGDHMSLMEQNEDLRQKNYHLDADNKKLRQDVEILKGSHQLHTDMKNPLIYSSEPFGKDEPTEKKDMSDAEVQTEDFRHLQDGHAVCTTIKMIEALYQEVKNKQVAMEKDLWINYTKTARVFERLEIELAAKQALQADYDRVKADQDRVKADQQKQNEKLRDEMKHQRLVTFGTNAVSDQTCSSLAHSLSEAIGKQNEVGQMIVNVQTKQKPGTSGCFKPLLVGFLVTVTIVFLVSLVSISIDSTDPNALYDRHHYI